MASLAIQRLEKTDVLRAAETFRPTRKLQKWVVIINGKRFPARPLLLHAAGVAPNDPTNSHQAVAKLQELGFETHYADETPAPGVLSAAQSGPKESPSAELRWLADHRATFAGRWVALQGDRLLASGENAREVFSKVKHLSPPPVLLRVEETELPFAGW